MKPTAATYYFLKHKLSSVLMIVALVWLTVSLPYVYSFQQETKKTVQLANSSGENSDEDNNPLTNTNEEKTESGTNTLSEYLHDLHLTEHHYTEVDSYFKCHPSDLYHAYHPDLVIPPPEV